ncbi:MAG: hypothetical protein Q6360_16650, partial [Candidatus Brocadiales bacterium]|nr:hypothetical protein [Candidatus Brocadiales bacterium]
MPFIKLLKGKLGFWKRGIRKQLYGEVTDYFLERLLKGMDMAFFLWNDYKKNNIEGFNGKYLFRTADNLVATSVIF